MSAGEEDLRAQQVLQDVLVLDGGRAVVLAVLLDLLVRVLLTEEWHLDVRTRAYATREEFAVLCRYMYVHSAGKLPWRPSSSPAYSPLGDAKDTDVRRRTTWRSTCVDASPRGRCSTPTERAGERARAYDYDRPDVIVSQSAADAPSWYRRVASRRRAVILFGRIVNPRPFARTAPSGSATARDTTASRFDLL